MFKRLVTTTASPKSCGVRSDGRWLRTSQSLGGKAVKTVGQQLNATKEIFDRLGSATETFGDRVANMLRSTKLYGNCFAGRREQLDQVKQRRNQRVANLTPQLAKPA
jgi:hypothetical protein